MKPCHHRVLIALFVLFAITAGGAPRANAAPTATISISPIDGAKTGLTNPIRGLKWKSDTLEIKEGYSKGATSSYVVVEGTYQHPFQKIFYQLNSEYEPRELGANANFSFEVPLTTGVTPVRIIIMNAAVTVNTYTYHVTRNDALNDDKTDGKDKAVNSKHRLAPSLGITSSSYSQSNGRGLNQILLTFKSAYVYALAPPKWDLGVSMYFSLFPLSADIPNIWARFLGLNIRIGYSKPLNDRWTLGLMGGAYYTTMLTSRDSKIGFENLMGPQIYPTISYLLDKSNTLGGYFKFSAVGSAFSLNSFSDHEIAFGSSLQRTVASGRVFTLSADFSQLNVLIDPVQITSQSLSLSGGMTF